MTGIEKTEEIIELTDVVEDGPGPLAERPFPPPSSGEIGGEGIDNRLQREGGNPWLESIPTAADPALSLREEAGEGGSAPEEIPYHSRPPGEAEIQDWKEIFSARVEEWLASAGAGILERMGREVFPRVAEKIIRQEIEKLKNEAEEKE